MILAIDYAKSMGVAWSVFNNTQISFTTIVGNQFKQLEALKSIIGECKVDLYVEELNFFRNAKTVRNLLLRTGFVAYSLSQEPKFVSTLKPRKYLGCKNKKEVFDLLKKHGARNNDESDAIALLLYTLQMKPEEVEFLGV